MAYKIGGSGLKAIRGLRLPWARAVIAEAALPAVTEPATLASEPVVRTHVAVASTPQILGEEARSADSNFVELIPTYSDTNGCSTRAASGDAERHGSFDDEDHDSLGRESDDELSSCSDSSGFSSSKGSEFESDMRVPQQWYDTIMSLPEPSEFLSPSDYHRYLSDIHGSAVLAEALHSSLAERAEVVHVEVASTPQTLGESAESADSNFAQLSPEGLVINRSSPHVASVDANRHWRFDDEDDDPRGSEADNNELSSSGDSRECSSANSSELESDVDYPCARREAMMNIPEPWEFLRPHEYCRYLRSIQRSAVSAETPSLLGSSFARRSEIGPSRDTCDLSSSNSSECDSDIDFLCVRREAMMNLPAPLEFLNPLDYLRHLCDMQASAVSAETLNWVDSWFAQRSVVGPMYLESDVDVRMMPTRDRRMILPHPSEYLTKRDMAKSRRKIAKDSNDPTHGHSISFAASSSSCARSSWE